MKIFLIAPYYFRWHYGKAYSDIQGIWKNTIWFFWNFFSIPLLLKTLLSPWRRLGEEKTKGFDIENFFTRLIVNSLMRLVGVIVKTIFITFGLIVEFFAIVMYPFVIIVWTLLPLLVVWAIIASLGLILGWI